MRINAPQRLKPSLFRLGVLGALVSVFLSGSLANAENPDLEFHYEKRSGEPIAVVNKRAVAGAVMSSRSSRSLTYQERRARSIASANALLTEAATEFGLQNFASETHVSSANEDADGNWVVRHRQLFRQVPVYGGGFASRVSSDGEAISANGSALRDINIDTRPKIKVSRAAKIALDDITSRKKVNPNSRAMSLKFINLCVTRGVLGKKRISKCAKALAKEFATNQKFYVTQNPALYIYNEDYLLNRSGGLTRLVWSVGVVNAFADGEEIFLDAQTGTIVRRSNASDEATERWVYDCSNPKGDNLCYSRLGPASTPPYTAYGSYTFGRREGAPARGANPVPGPSFGSLDVDTVYNMLGSDSPTAPKSLYSFFFEKFNRKGGNGLGGNGDGICPTYPTECPGIMGNNGSGSGSGIPVNVTKANVNVNGVDNGPVAFCDPGNAQFAHYPVEEPSIKFCRGSATSDVVAHEYAHAIPWFMNYQGDGVYYPVVDGPGESGALNESHSDLMAIAFQYYMEGETGAIDWVFGNGSNVPVLRVLSNPASSNYNDGGTLKPYPDRYDSPTFYCGAGDEEGVHINSLVPSYGTYLAVAGGSFNGCSISHPIGLQKAILIWHRALTHYFTTTTSFNGAYFGLTAACNDFASGFSGTSISNPPITIADCDSLAKGLQSVGMDQAGGCSGSSSITPSCAPLPGDFNGDNIADVQDWDILRCSWGQSGANLAADANHNGLIDAPDYNIWLAHAGNSFTTPAPMPTIQGDYDFDGDVDGNDFLMWQRTFGNTASPRLSDGNCNGVVDAADYVIWRDRFPKP